MAMTMEEVRRLGYEASKQQLSESNKKQREDALNKFEQLNKCCLGCGKKILYENRRYDFCNRSCSAKHHNAKRIKPKVVKIRPPKVDWGSMTNGELKSRTTTWQSWRTRIRQHAAGVMSDNSVMYTCVVCGYSKHNEICHIKSVSDFSDDAKLSEINDISNLQYMCPTHHWELDNDQLDT